MQVDKKEVNVINLRIIPYIFGAQHQPFGGFIACNLVFMVDVVVISFLAVIISDLYYAFLKPFIALCIFLFVLHVTIRPPLIKDHDSDWFGVLSTELMGLVLLLVIEIVFGTAQLPPF